jgi:hypothetical protein
MEKSNINIEDYIQAECGPVVTLENWNEIREKNRTIYLWLKSVDDKCFDAAILLKMFIRGITVVYGAIDIDSKDPSKGKTAHVVVRKGDWIYDNNCKAHILYEYYIRTFNMDVYAEFSGPSSDNYKEYTKMVLDGGYRKWCNERGYELLI